MVSGVRSSCEALATNRRCAANAPSSRASSPSIVSASSVSSSRGPVMVSRSCRLSAEIRRVAAVIARSGRSARPAMTQPSSTATTVMMPSAITPATSRLCDSPPGASARWFASCCWSWWICACARASADCGACPFWTLAAWTEERPTTTPPLIASSTAPDTRNRTPYSAVSRSRTVRCGSILIGRLPACSAARPPACPAAPNSGITVRVRPVLAPQPYNWPHGSNDRSNRTAQALRPDAGPGRDDVYCRARSGHRLRRAQRGREVHHDAGDPRP